MTDLINVSPLPATVASGGVIGAGETGPGDLEQPHDRALVENGVLKVADEPAPSKPARRARNTPDKETT